ncbi:MAG: lysine--tRNA ligase, partial [Candidatus Latescibacterota bacterium]|nr:lysine--tRNA ligase [Candidatus Latescibacterota bacterium]
EYQEVTHALVEKGLNYSRDFVLPSKLFRDPNDAERALLMQIVEKLQGVDDQDENALQSIPFDSARSVDMEPRALFCLFYEVVLGQERGPRFGSFARMVGVEKVRDMINARLA